MSDWKPLSLISADYLEEQRRLHGAPRGYGGSGRKWADDVLALALKYRARSILDYGCGRGTLGHALLEQYLASDDLDFDVREYDPAVPEKSRLPAVADLVVCTDVLEHIESDRIWNVLEHLASVTRCAAFIVVSLVASNKQLSDGRQAHILLRSVEWWRTQVRAHGFVIVDEPAIRPEKQWVAILEHER